MAEIFIKGVGFVLLQVNVHAHFIPVVVEREGMQAALIHILYNECFELVTKYRRYLCDFFYGGGEPGPLYKVEVQGNCG